MKMRTIVNGLAAMAAAAVLIAGCENTPTRDTADTPPQQAASPRQEAEQFSSWRQVYETAVEGSNVKRASRGFVEHRRLRGHAEGSYFVYGRKDLKTPVGFFLPNGDTYLYINDNNSGKVVSKSLGPLNPAGAVKLLLNIEADVEFESRISR